MIRYETGSILDGRRLIGRTYLVPCSGTIFDADGTISGGDLADLRLAVDDMIASMDGTLVVWHRPKGSRAGGYTAVNAATVPDEAVVLRSRRD
jgi:hypothetical protein